MEPLQIQQNVPSVVTLTITDESVMPNIPVDLTGLTVFISVKKLTDYKDDDSGAIITSEITIHTYPLLGITDWELTPTETYVPIGKYKADVRVYSSDLAFINSDTFNVDIVPVVTKRLT